MTRIPKLAQQFLLASGLNGAILYVLGVLGIPLVRSTFVVCLLITVGIVWRLRISGPGRVDWLPLVLLVLPYMLAAYVVVVVPLSDWDGRLTWIPKAEAIVHEASIRGPFFFGERGLNLHNRYPLLVPLDVAAIGPQAARVWYVLIPLAALIWCYAAIRERFGAPASWLVVFAAWLPPIVVAPEGSAMSAYSDLAVMAFLGAALLSIDDLYLTSIWLAFLVLTKNEGMMLAVCVLIASSFVHRRRVWIVSIAPLLAGLLLAAWRRSIPAAYDEQYEVLFRELPSKLPRLFEGMSALARHAVTFENWGMFWIIAVVAFVVGLKYGDPVAIASVLAIAGYCAAYAVTSWNIDELARVSANRLLSHLFIPALLCIAAMRTRVSLIAARTPSRSPGSSPVRSAP